MEVLTLSCHRSGEELAWGSEKTLTIDGGEDWFLSGPPAELAEVQAALGSFAKPLAGGLLLSFGNCVGLVPVPGRATLNVVTRKCGVAEFEQMLGDIARISSGLPFSVGDRARLASRRHAASGQVPFHAFLYLRHILSDVASQEDAALRSLRLVIADPHRRLVRESALCSLENVSRLSPAALRRTLTAPGSLQPASGALGITTMAVALRGHLPRAIEELRVADTFDTVENRLVKGFLDLAERVLARVERAASRALGRRGTRLRVEAAQLRRLLEPIVRSPLWSEVGTLEQVPMSSTVLQRRRGYREIFKHYFRLQQAMAWLPLSHDDARELAEVKDIAKLYELWCFFQVLEAVKAIWGEPRSAALVEAGELEINVRRGMEVTWGNGALLYNASFTQERPDRRSYSLSLYPDVALRIGVGDGAVWHLFDAKFKLERPSADGADDDEREIGFKREDVMKMHGYRDALKAVTVRALYPGNVSRFFEAAGSAGGVGALALAPGWEAAELRGVIRSLLETR